MASVKVVLGASGIGSPPYATAEEARPYVDALRSAGHKEIDTARMYPNEAFGKSETVLGELDAPSWAVIDTKILAFAEKAHSKENLAKSIDASLKALKVDKVSTMYLHMPLPDTPFAEVCEGMDAAFRQGKFERWGICNHSPQQVEELVEICEQKGWAKPSVYQGQYNAIARRSEQHLVPVLRKHGMSYYAYTPSGAGFFSGNVTAASADAETGRFSKAGPAAGIYGRTYIKPELLEASQKVQQEAKKHGIGGHAAALRWALHHSVLNGAHGDAIIVAGSKMQQIEENMRICGQGPLPQELVKAIEDVWPAVEPVAPWAWPGWSDEELKAVQDSMDEMDEKKAKTS